VQRSGEAEANKESEISVIKKALKRILSATEVVKRCNVSRIDVKVKRSF
jgi:hypothetical protein